MSSSPSKPHRGALSNPKNRFEQLSYEDDPECPPEERSHPKTLFLKDHSESLITYNDSPDIGFSASINPYRGCEHGCAYCYARPTHEYLGFSAGIDFETRIMVKTEAPVLLRRELDSPKWKPQIVIISGVTDCYQPAERHFKITRQCLEVFAEFGNPIAIITKNHLVTRDIDVLLKLHEKECAAVNVSVTTLNPKLAAVLEPRASLPAHRLRAIEKLAKAGIPVGVMSAPIIPGLNDSEIPKILEAARNAGATRAGYTIVRLPYGVKTVFTDWLRAHFPEKYNKVMGRILEVRDGKLNDPNFGSRMKGQGEYAKQVGQLFRVSAYRLGLNRDRRELSVAHFKRKGDTQLSLF